MQSVALITNKNFLTVKSKSFESNTLQFFGNKILAAIAITPVLAAVTFLSPFIAFADASTTSDFSTSTALLVGNQIVFGTVVTFFLGLATSLWIYKTISA